MGDEIKLKVPDRNASHEDKVSWVRTMIEEGQKFIQSQLQNLRRSK